MNSRHTEALVEEGVRGVNRSRTIALGIGVLAVFGAEVGVDLASRLSPGELGNYVIQLVATFIGALLAVAIGLALYDFQSIETDQRRSRQLNEAMVGELQATLDILEARHSISVPPPTGAEKGEEAVTVVLTHLEPVACEEAIRNAILGPQDVMALSHLARHMRLYNVLADRLEAVLWEPSMSNQQLRYFRAAKDVRRQQNSVIAWCKVNIEGFSKQGIDIPPRHYSQDTNPQDTNLSR
jgi:hypothetical protein